MDALNDLIIWGRGTDSRIAVNICSSIQNYPRMRNARCLQPRSQGLSGVEMIMRLDLNT